MDLNYAEDIVFELKEKLYDLLDRSDNHEDVEDLIDELDNMIAQEAEHIGEYDDVSEELEDKIYEAQEYLEFVSWQYAPHIDEILYDNRIGYHIGLNPYVQY